MTYETLEDHVLRLAPTIDVVGAQCPSRRLSALTVTYRLSSSFMMILQASWLRPALKAAYTELFDMQPGEAESASIEQEYQTNRL